MVTPTPAKERRSPFDNHMPAVDEGAEVPEGVSPRTAAEAADKHTPLPPDQAPASRLRSRRSLDAAKRSESMLLGQVHSGPPPLLGQPVATGAFRVRRGTQCLISRCPARHSQCWACNAARQTAPAWCRTRVSRCCKASFPNLTCSSSPAWTQPGPINADDGHVSGDLDGGRSLRVQTRTPSRALDALVDPDIPLTPDGDHPKDPFAVRRALVALRDCCWCLVALPQFSP